MMADRHRLCQERVRSIPKLSQGFDAENAASTQPNRTLRKRNQWFRNCLERLGSTIFERDRIRIVSVRRSKQSVDDKVLMTDTKIGQFETRPSGLAERRSFRSRYQNNGSRLRTPQRFDRLMINLLLLF